MFEETGRVKLICYQSRKLRICNQRSSAWAHPYDQKQIIPPVQTLTKAGCGIFSVVQAIDWMHGIKAEPETLADFSVEYGGRGDDGTDRPALLAAMMAHGLCKKYGFYYENDGLRNDADALFEHLIDEKGTALCNLRVGHIVTLIGAQVQNGEKQVLAMDPHSESMHEKVRENVRECIAGSEITENVYNENGVCIGQSVQYAMYWAPLFIVRDFNLLHIASVMNE